MQRTTNDHLPTTATVRQPRTGRNNKRAQAFLFTIIFDQPTYYANTKLAASKLVTFTAGETVRIRRMQKKLYVY